MPLLVKNINCKNQYSQHKTQDRLIMFDKIKERFGFSPTLNTQQDGSPDGPSEQPQTRFVKKTPMIVAGGLLLGIIAIILFSPDATPNTNNDSFKEVKQNAQTKEQEQNSDSSNQLQAAASSQTFTPPETETNIPQTTQGTTTEVPAVSNTTYTTTPAAPANYNISPEEQKRLEQLAIQNARKEILRTAIHSDISIFSNDEFQNHQQNQEEKKQTPQPNNYNKEIPIGPPETSNYLLHTRAKAVSRFEIKTGTIIPAYMIGGINSDLPGQILAQVAQNVYDSLSGDFLLIPMGSKLIGTYENKTVNGQNRVFVVWNRIIFPDQSSLNLDGMGGVDQQGYAGFKDKVNTHAVPAFAKALFISAITAGVQLSQPRSQQGDYSYNAQQITAASLGQQMNQLGMGYIQKNMNQAPTLTIRPGYQFNVMVNKDIVLPTYKG
jgi:type IV secretory pathway VirB10-like protein